MTMSHLIRILLAATFCFVVPTSGAASVIYRISIDGPISPATADYIESAIEKSRDDGANALIVRLDTPGGLLNSTKTIVKAFMASPVPIIVYVAPGGSSATSAGVFIAMAGHIAVMAPGTTIGAAHPVSGGGEDIGGDMRKKVENYAVSFVESIANKRGRNVEWAAQAVRESVSITEQEAVELRVVDFIAKDANALLEQSHGREIDTAGETRPVKLLDADAVPIEIVDISMTLRQRVLNVITDPNIAYLLMMAGMLGLYMEFSNPGVVFPGVAGVICLLLALLAGQVLPISSTAAILIVVGMGFLVAELFVPSFGVLGFGGILAVTLGSIFLYTPDSELAVDRRLIAVTMTVFALIVAAIVTVVLKDRRRRAETGSEGMIGERGVCVSAVHRTGKVRVHGELWNAQSNIPIAKNTFVSVVSVEGLTITVAPNEEIEQ
jgi:membrane-bound serine protease (ClpP class)